MLELGSLVAYKERIAPDPMSGANGVLRDEWRVRLVEDFDQADLTDAWGLDWRRHSPFAGFVLEHRYIRRGVEEPWMPFQSANSYRQALSYIDAKAIAVCPVLIEVKQKIAEENEERERKRLAEEKEKEEVRQLQIQREKSEQAFRRMAYSSKFGHYAAEWQDFVKRNNNETTREIILSNPEAIGAYNAVFDAITVPKKVKAIKEFFKQAEKLGLL